MALKKVQGLEDTTESLRTENQNTQQLKEKVILLEAQLEKQLQSVTIDNQSQSEEMTHLKQLLLESERQLSVAQKEAQAHKEELSQVRQQLTDVTQRAQGVAENGQPEAEECEVQAVLEQTLGKLHSEEAQKSAEDAASIEDVVQLKECLDKERKMTKDLGQAATKLQELLRNSQDKLAKEKEKVRTLEEQLQEKGTGGEPKQGTSV